VAIFEQAILEMQALYQVKAAVIVCDAHPQYASSRWAAQQNLPLKKVCHHHAHAAALAWEFAPKKRWLTFTWDGVGLGEDGQLWGGETLLGEIGDWRRVATLRTFKLPGGERAAREVWRSTAGLCWELDWDVALPLANKSLLKTASQLDINSPRTSAVGRLFDGVANLLGLLETASFEGQAGMLLEQSAAGIAPPIMLPISKNAAGLLVVDWQPLLLAMRDEHRSVAYRAMQFHQSLAQSIVAQAQQIQAQYSFELVGLTGGVFQNKLLAELTLAALAQAGFEAALPAQIPCNDGGLALGQLMEASDKSKIRCDTVLLIKNAH
jgi:hydrogenase maturation protein HypF